MKLVNLIPLKEIDFRNQNAFDAYQKQHQLRPDTKVTIAGKVTTAGQAAQQSKDKAVKGTSVFGNNGGTYVFDKKDPSEEVLNAIKNDGYGNSMVTLYRKNKNGKIVQDVKFTSKEDITSEIIKKTADTYDIDLNLLNKFGLSNKIKDTYGRMQPVRDLMMQLILTDVQKNQFAPGEIADSDYYYKIYSEKANKESNVIKKAIDPEGIQKQADKQAAKKESDKTDLYNEESAKDVTDALSKTKKLFSDATFSPKDVAKVANKYKMDVNRILQHPEMYFDVSGFIPNEEDLKAWGYKSLSDFALAKLGETIYFGKSGDSDSMDELSNLQLAYPLKYKNLSDDEWNKTMQSELENPTTVDGGLRNFIKKERGDDTDNSFVKISEANSKNQSKWVKEQAKKNKNYVNDMFAYQEMISKDALNKIDEMLKSDSPPPVQAKALYRGMAMTPKDYSSFMKSFKEGGNIDLPISSFSLDSRTATEFANNVGNANALVDKANNQSIIMKVINSNNTFNGFCMNANIGNVSAKKSDALFGNDFGDWEGQHEVLLPSNNKYKVVKTEAKKMQGGRSLTIVTLEQIGIKNEIKLKEFINNDETDILKKHLQYPNRTSLLYKNGLD